MAAAYPSEAAQTRRIKRRQPPEREWRQVNVLRRIVQDQFAHGLAGRGRVEHAPVWEVYLADSLPDQYAKGQPVKDGEPVLGARRGTKKRPGTRSRAARLSELSPA